MNPGQRLTVVSRTAAILFLPGWAAVVGGELVPSTRILTMSDKATHFTAYFILALLATIVFKAGSTRGAICGAVLGWIFLAILTGRVLVARLGRD